MTEVTRGEFDLLKQIVSELGARQTAMDDHGTRGLGTLQQQITEVTKDLTELKTETTTWQVSHNQQHEIAQRERREEQRDRRRFRIMATIGAAASMATVLGLLVEVLRSLH